MAEKSDPAELLQWLARRLAELPPGGTLTVTWRRDSGGRLSREVLVKVEQREAWEREAWEGEQRT